MHKRKFLMVHDYEHGGVAFWGLARSAQELEDLFESFEAREDYDEAVWDKINIKTFDIDEEPKRLFIALIAHAEGKKGFRCRFECNGTEKEVIVWAHNEQDIVFSNLLHIEPQFIIGRMYEGLEEYVDVDRPADYMRT